NRRSSLPVRFDREGAVLPGAAFVTCLEGIVAGGKARAIWQVTKRARNRHRRSVLDKCKDGADGQRSVTAEDSQKERLITNCYSCGRYFIRPHPVVSILHL